MTTNAPTPTSAPFPFPEHPLSSLFPRMPERDYEALRDDIAQHGQQTPIALTPSGELLDGAHRARACAELGITPQTITLDIDPGQYQDFVVSANLNRRHLSDSDRALVAARLAERTATIPQAAEQLRVSQRQVSRAKLVTPHPELARAVAEGKLALSAASAAATEAPDHIDAAAAELRAGRADDIGIAIRRVQAAADTAATTATLDTERRELWHRHSSHYDGIAATPREGARQRRIVAHAGAVRHLDQLSQYALAAAGGIDGAEQRLGRDDQDALASLAALRRQLLETTAILHQSIRRHHAGIDREVSHAP